MPTLLSLFIIGGKGRRRPCVPDDLAKCLVSFVPRPADDTIGANSEPPRADSDLPQPRIAETWRSAVKELYSVLTLIDAGKVSISAATRRPNAKGIAAVQTILAGGDFYHAEDQEDSGRDEIGPIRAFAWPLIMQVAGLAQAAGTRLTLTPAGRKALSQPAHTTLRRAWQAWLETSMIDEFSRISTIKGQSDHKRLTAVSGRRAIINAALGLCPRDQWVELDELFRFMRSQGLIFEIAWDPWKLYIGEPHYGSLGYAGSHDWSILQGRYIMALLFEYAATLGLIDIAYTVPGGARRDFDSLWGTDDLDFLSRYDGLLALRINALGAYILGLSPDYAPAQEASPQGIRVLPNFDIVAINGRFEHRDEAVLSIFCTRSAEAVFTLSKTSVLSAVDKGHRVDELRGFLASSPAGLPPGVQRFLDDMAHKSTMLSITGTAMLIECRDAVMARRIAHNRKTKALCRLAGTHTLAVPMQAQTAFRRAVFELGYPVRRDHHDEEK